uniref:PAS domain-containing protein n=1 Tax=Alexandrium catenella TaxID=2925 RepID=A0A7S1M9Z9_ALECA
MAQFALGPSPLAQLSVALVVPGSTTTSASCWTARGGAMTAGCGIEQRPPMEEVSDAVILVDPRRPGFPITKASSGFSQLTGHSSEELIGQPVSTLMCGVPAVAISRSAQKNFEDFCKASLVPGVSKIAESWHIHAHSRKDGSLFNSLVMLGFCHTRLGPYVAIVHEHMCEGVAGSRVPPSQLEQLREKARDTITRARLDLSRQGGTDDLAARSSEGAAGPLGGFFTGRLSDRAMLFKDDRSAVRREANELPIGCLLFGNAPLVPTKGQGLRFSVRIDEAKGAFFKGLPMLGFTQRKPVDTPDMYPTVAKCLGRSVLVGGMCEATARDKEDNFKVGFKKIPESEIAQWGGGAKEPDFAVHAGDVVECRYLPEGLLQFWVNGVKMLDFDIGRPLEAEGLYWPVVDVAFSVTAVTLLDEACTSSRRGEILLKGEGIAGKGEGIAGHVPTVSTLSTFVPTGDLDEDAESDISDSFSSMYGEMGTACRELTSLELEQDFDEQCEKKEQSEQEEQCETEEQCCKAEAPRQDGATLPTEFPALPARLSTQALAACTVAATVVTLAVVARRAVRRQSI